MAAMSPELGKRLLRLNLAHADNTIDPERAVWLACDLLVAELDSPTPNKNEATRPLPAAPARFLMRNDNGVILVPAASEILWTTPPPTTPIYRPEELSCANSGPDATITTALHPVG
jgi:hypothetical protein